MLRYYNPYTLNPEPETEHFKYNGYIKAFGNSLDFELLFSYCITIEP